MMRRTRLRGAASGDDGGVLIGLLAVLIVAMVVATVTTSVTNGQKQAQFDQSYEQALQVAEDGMSQMISRIQSSPAGTTSVPDIVTSTYTAKATKAGVAWTVEASGTSDGRTRKVRSTLTTTSLFSLAAFGKIVVDFNGGNGADSYSSTTSGGSNLCSGVPCVKTGVGTVATNGVLKLKGQTSAASDRLEIYNAAENVDNPLPTATGMCGGVTQTCDYYTPGNTGKLRYFRDPIVLPPITACSGAPGVPTSFNGTGTLNAGQVYNFTNATLTSSTVINGTQAQPTVICMNGSLTIPNANKVNFTTGTNGSPAPRPAGSLVILSTGSNIDMGNHSAIAAAIYAPNALAQGGAQSDVFGSLVANAIDSNGGFAFHYDQALSATDINAPAARSDWVEVR